MSMKTLEKEKVNLMSKYSELAAKYCSPLRIILTKYGFKVTKWAEPLDPKMYSILIRKGEFKKIYTKVADNGNAEVYFDNKDILDIASVKSTNEKSQQKSL